jgi:hypothetical protein
MSGSRIELHSRDCTCRGGSWVLLEGAEGSPCGGPEAEDAEKVTLSLEKWRQAGKPGCVEAYEETRERLAAGERREFKRYQVQMELRLSRIATSRDPDTQPRTPSPRPSPPGARWCRAAWRSTRAR